MCNKCILGKLCLKHGYRIFLIVRVTIVCFAITLYTLLLILIEIFLFFHYSPCLSYISFYLVFFYSKLTAFTWHIALVMVMMLSVFPVFFGSLAGNCKNGA